MRRRLYFLLPDVKTAKTVHNELLLAKIEERNQHVVAREGIDLKDLPEADFRQKSDISHGAQMGLILGGLTGMILSSIAISIDMIVPGLEVWSVSSLTVGGAFLGTFASSMIAVNVKNTHLKPFQEDIDAGRVLYMVDVPFKQVEEISELVRVRHPEADMKGIDPTIPAFP